MSKPTTRVYSTIDAAHASVRGLKLDGIPYRIKRLISYNYQMKFIPIFCPVTDHEAEMITRHNFEIERN